MDFSPGKAASRPAFTPRLMAGSAQGTIRKRLPKTGAGWPSLLGSTRRICSFPFKPIPPTALAVTQAFVERPRCDALVTAVPGLGLGVTGADCGMILFADKEARVIGAAHAGWKGALDGVLEATLAAMETLGARRASTAAVLGPAISQKNYEVGAEFEGRFRAVSKSYASFFSASPRDGHFHFDLPGFIAMRLRRAGIGSFEDLARDTYAEPEMFYSYRRCVHQNEPDYGRQIAAIALV